jgi:hypothetical protein
MARIIVAEVCPQCGSLDVRATEPPWFAIELDRRAELDDGWIDRIEFACRVCEHVWD